MSLAAAATVPLTMTSERLRVLLVDDAADVRFLLRRTLESDGRFEVVGEAADGVEGVRLATKFLPDVAVVDLAMPIMDGFQAIPLIRGESPATKVVVLTAFRGSHMAAEAAGAGADAYVEKGSGFDSVVTTITSLYGTQPLGSPRRLDAAARAPGDDADTAAAPVPAVRDVDEILSKLNHELRTPVAVIQGFAVRVQQMAAQPDADMELLRRSAEAIERNANVVASILTSVADARDVDTGRLELQLQVVNLGSLVSELAGDLEFVVGDHPLVLALDDVGVHADPVRVRQIVTNLVSNAAKFGSAGSPIEVRVSAGDASGMAELAVRDHGPGVPAGREHEVFGKFTRLTKSTKGTGLGLYISRGIAHVHGGELTLENSPSGCRFILRLPLPVNG